MSLKKKKSPIYQLYQFSNFETRRRAIYNNNNYNLHRIKFLLEKLGNPQNFFQSIHIAGSKGKGSVAYYLAEFLYQNGFKVGANFSPHVVDERERFYCNGKKITFSHLNLIAEKVLEVVKNFSLKPTVFDLFTAMAFTYFKMKKISLAVIETGLGGRWDSTNVLKPHNILASVITQIDKEHTDKLGSTLKKIAIEKAEIIKNKKPVFFIFQSKTVNLVIEKKAQKTKSPLYSLKKNNPMIEDLFSANLDDFILGDEARKKNLSLVLEIITVLQLNYSKISPNLINKIFKQPKEKKVFLGRYQKINNFILDGAHSPLSIKNLISIIHSDKDLKKYKKIKVLFYSLPDKPFQSLLKLIPLEWDLYFIDPKLFFISEEKRKIYRSQVKRFFVSKRKVSWKEIAGFSDIKSIYQSEDLYLVTGSFRLVGWFLKNRVIQKLEHKKLF